MEDRIVPAVQSVTFQIPWLRGAAWWYGGRRRLIPAVAGRAQRWLEWRVSSWEPSYREVRLSDLRSDEDLSAIVYDAGVQLGAGEAKDTAVRTQALSSLVRLKGRLVKETSSIVEELLAGWRELGGK